LAPAVGGFVGLVLLRGVFDIPATFADDVEVLTSMKDLFFVFEQKVGDHLLPESKSFKPVKIIEVLGHLLFLELEILFDYKFFEVVFQLSFKDPFLHYGDIRHRALLENELK
jgi:hypothetical protein